MIIDITGTELIPGNNGRDCPGNGMHSDKYGNILPCCCDECDYMMCCTETHQAEECMYCEEVACPHISKKDNS